MSHEFVTYLVLVVGGLVAVGAVVTLVLVPVARIYPTWWERMAALVLAAFVVAVFATGGVYVGLAFVDRFLS
ncbi:hypothetical protein PAI11_06860 [Patulibacter medicamentivorans]|jgi:hypothetical protein|uniref:Uncharacterized protein n=1 Tax=Patulibacter medicamentivorans TaxID=1097667 RepID=H0E1M4_9ACTN|nr:hypothetical protein [Patulibacter medicamentivorans]EHN12419.1 hypothetical protein PAI11_06860 [Patulibacter medicamentivorans]